MVQGNYNSSHSAYGGSDAKNGGGYHGGNNQRYQPRQQQYQVKKPGTQSSASSGTSSQAKCSDYTRTYNGKNGRSKDLDVKVKPFCVDKSEMKSSNGAKAADTGNGSSNQDAKSVSNTSVKSIVRLKYEMCKNFKETGSCKYGDRCLFAHGDHELINRGPPIATT